MYNVVDLKSLNMFDLIVMIQPLNDQWRYRLNSYFRVLRLVAEKKNEDWKNGLFYKNENISRRS